MPTARSCLSAAVLCLVALSPSASVATPIVPVSQTRSVTAAASHPFGTPSSDSESAPDFGPFDGYASATSAYFADFVRAEAQQTSTIGADRILLSVDGYAVFGLYGGTATATSAFDVTFDLLVESEYNLFYQSINNFFVTTSGALSDSGGVLVQLFPNTAQTGTLAPGRYRLEAFATGHEAPDSVEGQLFQQLTLEFTPIPEPSTAWLLAGGIVALAAARRPNRLLASKRRQQGEGSR
jgi:hypothetical protein